MNKKFIIASLLLGGIAGVWLLARRNGGDDGGGQAFPEPDVYDPGAASFIASIEDYAAQLYYEVESNVMPIQNTPYLDTQIAAMLETIKWSEGTAGRGDPYRVCFGYRHTVSSMVDHPAVTGEWRGETLSDAMCKGAGFGPGCVSTAAGAFQIIKPTWVSLKRSLNLPDFSARSQDLAAVELLKRRGALGPLAEGRFADAVQAARKEWASLPGAGYGQGERSIASLEARFVGAGGVLA